MSKSFFVLRHFFSMVLFKSTYFTSTGRCSLWGGLDRYILAKIGQLYPQPSSHFWQHTFCPVLLVEQGRFSKNLATHTVVFGQLFSR